MTLYTLTNDSPSHPCSGQCATAWPPLLLPSGTVTAVGAAGVSGLGSAAVPSGTQVTDKGALLYRFSGDQAPGDARGEGISSFGGVWHVVKATQQGTVTAPAATNPPTSNAPAPTPTTAYSYGY
ncbi:MAG TPA: hypothetical protein VGP92_18505 [Acidimicrobiia bacterium]|jgi:predicted lipoprotein with Yx(FWY)xxD motif|nr:hypothetical protein [Acidimicrobiia bacterium]